jgi:putative membrane protein
MSTDQFGTSHDRQLPGGSSARWVRVIEHGFLIAGLVLFAVLLHEIGARTVVANVRTVSWGISLIVLQETLAIAANTLGWRYAFPWPPPPIGFLPLMAARLAGDAVNYVTPTATLGGEFVRVRLLRERIPTTAVVASVAIAKLTQTVGQIAFVVVGFLFVLDDTPLPASLRHGLMIGIFVLTVLACMMLAMQRRGLFAPLLRALHAMGLPEYSPGIAGRVQRLDDEIARFYQQAGWGFVRSSLCFFVGWALGVLEAYLILFFLRLPVSLAMAVAVEVFSTAIDAMLFFVPGKVGTQEGGKVLIFTLLGLDAAKGLSFGILRRIRELVWAGVGLLILSRLQSSPRAVVKPAAIGS